MRRDGVMDEGMNPGDWYGGGDKPRPQPCGKVQRCAAPASDAPSFPRTTTMTTLARGDALHRTMLLEGVVGGRRGKMRRDGMLDGVMEG